MIIFKTFDAQLTIPGDEYALYMEDSTYPNGDPTEALVIQTPAKKYKFTGMDSGRLDAPELMTEILAYIAAHRSNPVICVDFDEIAHTENAMETIIAFLSVES